MGLSCISKHCKGLSGILTYIIPNFVFNIREILEFQSQSDQRNMLLSNFPQGSKCFEKWPQEVSNAAKLINYDNYDWQQAACDAIILQTSNTALRERALQENVTYDQLLKMGIVKEQSAKGAAFLEQASCQQSVRVTMEEDVGRLQSENKQLKSKMSQQQCYCCGREKCPQGSKCPANGKKCSKCKKIESFCKGLQVFF